MKLSEALLLIATAQIGIVRLGRAWRLTTPHRCRVILRVSRISHKKFNAHSFFLCHHLSYSGDTICGWQHDADHDFDFERRSGYNNRTISILTGPSADHTIGTPFQGHYMVINTNADVYTKSARLISPLYRLNAQKLCFRFYYHMYGVGVGTLRVYAKPESIELQEILMNDEVLEAHNDYLVFEVKGESFNL